MKHPVKCPACSSLHTKFLFDKNSYPHSRCESCGTIFCSRMPTRQELQKAYLKDDYIGNPGNPAIMKLANRYFLWQFRRFMKKKMRILDFGCGRGELLQILKEQGHDALGIDFSPENVRNGRRKGLKMKLYVEKSDYGKFDLVIMKYSLEHLAEPAEVITNLRLCLKEDGLIFIDIPNINSQDYKKLGKDWLIIVPPYHLLYFTKKGTKIFLEKHGFSMIELTDSKIPSYIFPFSLPFPLNVPIKLLYLAIPRSLLPGEGSDIRAIARKAR